ncbi:MAG: hypothetical protein RMA76_05930 [Deltaproteobacteria bacterium]|jgi:hypothetical protein
MTTETQVPGMFDLVLSDQARLDRLMLDDSRVITVIEQLLALSVLGLVLTGVAVGVAAEAIDISSYHPLAALSRGTAVLWMPLTAVAAFLGALSICLPSFYFYTQLAGIDASFRLVTAQALRAQATTSVLLLAALPVFLALALANVAVDVASGSGVLWVGLLLPFVLGLFGISSVYRSFSRLVLRLPKTHARRGKFVRRLVLAWGAVYTFVAPVAMFRIGQALSELL